jgi:hypothetical protein
VRQRIKSSLSWLPLFCLFFGMAAPLAAQVPPGQRTPLPGRYNPSVGPAALRAAIWNDPCCQIFLVFPAVINPEKYRVTRSENGGAETTIAEAAVTSFGNLNFGYTCTALPNIRPTGCIFGDAGARRGVNYTYRVWAIYPGGVVSPPSPSASARLP